MSSSSSIILCLLLLSIIMISSIESRAFYAMNPTGFDYDQSNQIIRNTMKRNRMCLFNAGLSAGCDLSDMVQARSQANKFMSFAGPGKK